MAEVLLQLKNVDKSYQQGTGSLTILRSVDFQVSEGEAVGIVGASGAGKSTLMHVLGTLDRPDRGQLLYRGQDLQSWSDDELAQFRNAKMGFVFQFHHLLSELTAVENIALPGIIGGMTSTASQAKAMELLEMMGLQERGHHYPSELSGGELQRIAIARALLRKPEILFADEPTGNLDSTNSIKVQSLFFQLKKDLGLTLVVVTHDPKFAKLFPRVLMMKDGRLETSTQSVDER